jgi:gliding motility-associated-like protein
VLINEYTAANFDDHNTPGSGGDNDDWFELYNAGASDVDISGWFLSDDKTDVTKWAVPAGVSVPAGGFMRVYCNGDGLFAGGYLHAGFKLTQCANEEILVSNTLSTIIDSITIKKTQKNHTRARLTDGSPTWGISTNSTPGASNASTFAGYAKRPDMSLVHGFYTGTQTLTLSSVEPTANSIRYTTNGTEPTITSTLYTAPISVTTTTLIKAKTFSTDATILPSFTEVNTYFIDVSTTLQVLSLGGDEFDAMFTGWGGPNEIESSFEFFNIAHAPQFTVYGTVRPHGNDSWAYDQKGIRYYVWDEFGYDNKMEYPFFTNTPRNDYDVLIFKAAGSDNYPGNVGSPGCHLRDGFAQRLSQNNNLNLEERSVSHCVIYINGQYWGLYEIRERVDVDFTEYYFNQGKKDVDILKYWGGMNVEEGSDTGWVNLYNYIMANDLSIPSNYAWVESQLHVLSFIDYFIHNTYLINTDWLNWNTMWWRGRADGGTKWRYTLWDSDNILDLGQNYTGLPSTDFTGDPCDVQSTGIGGSPEEGHIDMLEALLANPEFEDLYMNRYADLMNNTFSCVEMNALLDSIEAIIEPEMPKHLARWSGDLSTWEANMAYLRTQINGRCTVIAGGMVDCYELKGPYNLTLGVSPALTGKIKLNTIIAPTYPYSGTYFGGTTMTLVGIPNPGYVFDHWTINLDTLSPTLLDDTVTLTLDTNDVIVAYFLPIGVPPPPVDTTVYPPPPPPPPPAEATPLSVPGMFSPNGDGKNDIFYILGNKIETLDFQVFNRWGQLVFHATSPGQGWDGTYQGQALNTAVFAYILKATTEDGQVINKTGNITLVR